MLRFHPLKMNQRVQQLLFISISLLVFFPSVFSQTDTLSILKKYSSEYATTVGNERISLFSYSSYASLTKIDLLTGNKIIIDSVPNNPQNGTVLMDSSSCFYLKSRYASNGNDVIFSVVFLNYSGVSNQKDVGSKIISRPFKLNSKFYFVTKMGTYYALWESDGTVQGTQVVFQTLDEIKQLYLFENKIFFTTKNITTLNLFYYTTNANLIFSTLHPQSHVSLIFDDERPNGKGYFHLYRGAANYQFWETDYSFTGTSLFLDSTNKISLKVEENDSTFILSDYNSNRYYWRSSFNAPQQQSKITYALDTDTVYTQILNGPTTEYRQHNSYEHGLEWARAPKNDSIFVIQDLAPGIKKSINAGENIMGIPKMTYVENDTLFYTIMTNSNDKYDYLYEVNGNVYTCMFKVNDLQKCSNLFKHNGNFYWYVSQGDTLVLLRHSPSSNDVLQPTQPLVPNENYWYKEIAFSPNTYFSPNSSNVNYNNGIEIDGEGNSIASFSLRYHSIGQNSFFSSDNDIFQNIKGADVIVKHDPQGNIKWLTSMGSGSTIFFNNPQFKVDSENNIYVAGSIFLDAKYEADSIFIDRCGVVLTKIDGETGKVIWHKLLGESNYLEEFEIEKMVLDEQDNIYLALKFSKFNFSLEGLAIFSEASPSNALVKYDPNGEIIWLTNIRTPWENKYGETRVLEYQKDTKQLLAVQSQGYYNWSSSCEYSDWRYNYQIISSETGQINHSESFTGSDLGSLTKGLFNKNGELVHTGFFRGKLDFNDYIGESPVGTNCHTFAGFMASYSPKNKEHIGLSVGNDNPFFPIDIKKTNDFIFVFGTDNNDELNLIRFDHDMNEKGYLRLNQYASPFDFGDDQHFAVSDSFILFMGSNFVNDEVFDIHTYLPPMQRKSFLKIKNEGWLTNKKWFTPQKITPFGKTFDELIIYPNPFTDEINILYPEEGDPYKRFVISDLTGKIILEGTLTGIQKEKINAPDIASGLYTITLFGEESKISKRLLRL